MDTACKLMDAPQRGLLRVSPEVVVAFRYHDVRELSVTRAAGNMPIEALTGQSSRRETSGAVDAAASEPTGQQRAFFKMLADQAFTHNPPLHKLTRRMLSRQLLRHNLQRLKPLASEIIASLLASIQGRSEIDFGSDLARPYVARFWGDMLGLTPDESAEVAGLMRDLDLIFQLERTAGDSAVIDRAADRYVEIVTRRVDGALLEGGNKLIAEMAADLADIDVDGKPQSLGSYVAANLFDGFHTVGVALSNASVRAARRGTVRGHAARPGARAEGLRRVAADRAAAAAHASLRPGRHRARRRLDPRRDSDRDAVGQPGIRSRRIR